MKFKKFETQSVNSSAYDMQLRLSLILSRENRSQSTNRSTKKESLQNYKKSVQIQLPGTQKLQKKGFPMRGVEPRSARWKRTVLAVTLHRIFCDSEFFLISKLYFCLRNHKIQKTFNTNTVTPRFLYLNKYNELKSCWYHYVNVILSFKKKN